MEIFLLRKNEEIFKLTFTYTEAITHCNLNTNNSYLRFNTPANLKQHYINFPKDNEPIFNTLSDYLNKYIEQLSKENLLITKNKGCYKKIAETSEKIVFISKCLARLNTSEKK